VPSPHAPLRGSPLTPRAWRELVIEANDGIIATAGIVEGLLAADVRNRTILISAAIALVVGSVSSAGARYSEAAFQRDAAVSAVAHESALIDLDPEAELEELVELYVAKGLSPGLAREVATELMEHDALAAHVEEELDVEDEDFLPPALVALGVGLAYAAGATLPILISLLVPSQSRVLTTLVAVTVALAITSYVGARIGHTHPARTVLRAIAIGVSTLLLALVVGQALE
jgi:vacuolar iron transporter family protein